MLKSIHIVCLLLANFHLSIEDDSSQEKKGVQNDSIEEKEGDLPRTVFACSGSVSKPMIESPSLEATIGRNVTLECVSQNGSLPISYTLYKGKNKMLSTVIKHKAGETAVFNFVINSDNDLGEYKCKVENKCMNASRYTPGFNFTLRVSNKDNVVACNVVACIVSPLLLLIVLTITIPLLIRWCKSRKSKRTSSRAGSVSTTYPAAENCATYEKIVYENEDVAYTDVKFNTKEEDYRNVIVGEDTTVNYAEVVIRK